MNFRGSTAIFTVTAAILSTLLLPGSGLSEEVNSQLDMPPGFFQIRSQAPGQSLRMTMPHLLPGSIQPGIGIFIGTSLSNVWIMDSLVELDYEMLDSHLGITYGFSRSFGIALFFDERNYFGGDLDGFIQGFHDAFGIGQNGRDEVEKGLSTVLFKDSSGQIPNTPTDPSAFENSAVTFMTHYNFLTGEDRVPGVSLSGSVRYALDPPSGNDDGDLTDWNVAIGLAKRLSEKLFSCYHLGYTRFGQTDISGLTFEEDGLSFIAAVAWQVKPRFSLLAQYFLNEEVLKGFGDFSEPSHEIDLGVQWELPRGSSIELAIIENFITSDNSPDFGLHAGYSYHF